VIANARALKEDILPEELVLAVALEIPIESCRREFQVVFM
jgi:hypothetical protein